MDDTTLRMSFYFTYVMLITTGTITFIEALRTKNPTIRHIMNLETCISIIAAFFYAQFLEKIKQSESSAINYKELVETRYTDWFISTPFMLLVLCIFLSHEHGTNFHFHIFLTVILLNYAMLITGYMGEIDRMDKRTSLILGFLFFAALFAYIWWNFMSGDDSTRAAFFTFMTFAIVWSLYGVVYILGPKERNISYNALDLVAKCLVGIFFWMYFTGVVV